MPERGNTRDDVIIVGHRNKGIYIYYKLITMNEKMNAVLDELKNAEIANPMYRNQIVDVLKSIRFMASDVAGNAKLTHAERDKLNCVVSLSELVEKRLNLDEFDSIVELLGIDREAV